ncbi:phosphomannomutase/phosphoglucomutase [Halarcobacter anaerophilus]|uniref:Phospho-sugar mutase n=1 Tax=Halarcobacter anaerophilus TaxID=877500 RepID=A0A4Q0Y3E0_9BACT|nr:phosphomannomutase/phosphoglucomutase [Halarcobacter anaerophilus]QDF27646.1 phosphomannomutase / phosphoglucomutase [Halarcobacter anaerophilus]RXJ63995.1 phospho-sugar mutase [Halarcobacter anaerophilus]
MIDNSIFREYDIRGIVESQLNSNCVKLIGYFLGKIIFEKFKESAYVAVGYDARIHCPKLFSYLASGLNKANCKVLNMQMVPTGVNYFSNYQTFCINNKEINPCASIMITGSHNPKEYNGFKITIDKEPFFSEDLYKLRDKIIANQELQIEDNDKATIIDVKGLYIDYIVKKFSHLKGMKNAFIVDCGNGAANSVLFDIIKKLELNCKILYGEPDGNFPNHHPDPTIQENIEDILKEIKSSYDFGFAYDGDADRVVLLTKNNIVKGDTMALLFAKDMKNPTVVGEVKCSQIMYDLINKKGKAIMYKAGHSNLKLKLKSCNADFAVEVSGHIFFNDRYFGFDDGIYATFRVLELIKNGMNIDKEIESFPKTYSTEELKIKTTDKEKFLLVEKIKELLKNPPSDFPKIIKTIGIDGVRVIFEKGWGLIRASNTTPILVTRFESTDKNLVKEYEKKLNNLIKVAQNEINITSNKNNR